MNVIYHIFHFVLILRDLCVNFTIYYYYTSQFTLISSKRRKNQQLSSELAPLLIRTPLMSSLLARAPD